MTVTGSVSGARKASKPPSGRGGGSTPQVVTYFRTGQLGRGAFSCEWPPLVAQCWRTSGHDLLYIGVLEQEYDGEVAGLVGEVDELEQGPPPATPFAM